MVGIPSGIGQVKRDLGALIDALGVVGGGGSPNELRSDAGILPTVGVEETLARHVELLTQETVITTVVPGAGAIASATFSFPEDHYIQSMVVVGTSGVASFEWANVLARRFPATDEQIIYFAEDTDMVDLAAGTLSIGALTIAATCVPRISAAWPRFGMWSTDYEVTFRAKAAAGGTYHLITEVTRCPKGVPIPH